MSTISKYDNEAIQYTDTEAIEKALVGRKIEHTLSEGSDYDKVIRFVLDDGTVLRAHASDGGCACSNGCFSVDNPDKVFGTILGVEVQEVAKDYDYESKEDVEKTVTPGSISDGSAVIRLFVYDELGKHTLVESEGGDNGYYGWGYYLSVSKPGVSV